MIVPFAAIILVAVKNAQSAIYLYPLEIIMDEVIAPAVKFKAGIGRAIEGDPPTCWRWPRAASIMDTYENVDPMFAFV